MINTHPNGHLDFILGGRSFLFHGDCFLVASFVYVNGMRYMTEDEIIADFIRQYDIFGSNKINKHKKASNKEPRDSYHIYGKPKPNETQEERAERLANGYKKIDSRKSMDNDITAHFIVDHIFSKPCLKCGETDWHKLGCDRIDNAKGHLMNNVVCACYKCNITRRTKPFERFYGFPPPETSEP